MQVNCDFIDPVYWDNNENKLIPNDNSIKPIGNWQFSKIHCTTISSTTQEIVSADAQKFFFLKKTISYGDFLITIFLILLIFGLAIFGIRDFAKNRKLERL